MVVFPQGSQCNPTEHWRKEDEREKKWTGQDGTAEERKKKERKGMERDGKSIQVQENTGGEE